MCLTSCAPCQGYASHDHALGGDSGYAEGIGFRPEIQRRHQQDGLLDPTYEEALDLLAKLPQIAAYIFRMKYRSDTIIPPDPNLDMGGNFAHMMGIGKPYDDVSRLYFILHSDHESGNVSAHTGHLIASALSDIYYSLSGMINGLAGPLHGLANQEVLRWIQE